MARSSSLVYARFGECELPVRWAWYRPEVQVGDTVRILDASATHDGWHSFRVVAKRVTEGEAAGSVTGTAATSPVYAIRLDVEPLAPQE